MVIDIKEVLANSGKVIDRTVPVEADVLEIGGRSYEIVKKQPMRIIVSGQGNNKAVLKGWAHISVNIPCDRCLTDVETDFEFDIEKDLDFDKPADEFEDEAYIEDGELDTEKLLLSEVIMNFPTKTLCKDSCKGLCPVCGGNLNVIDCGCDREVPDPRMAAIKDLFKDFKEV